MDTQFFTEQEIKDLFTEQVNSTPKHGMVIDKDDNCFDIDEFKKLHKARANALNTANYGKVHLAPFIVGGLATLSVIAIILLKKFDKKEKI